MLIDKTFGTHLDNQKYFTRQGAYLISIQDHKVAVVKTPKGYFLLGGGLNTGEDHRHCIQREVLEESGYRSQIDSYICSAEEYQLHKKLGYFHPIQYYYSGRLLDKVAPPQDKDHELCWISLDNIADKMYLKSQGWAIQYYLDL